MFYIKYTNLEYIIFSDTVKSFFQIRAFFTTSFLSSGK